MAANGVIWLSSTPGFGAVLYVVEYVDYVAGGQKMVC